MFLNVKNDFKWTLWLSKLCSQASRNTSVTVGSEPSIYHNGWDLNFNVSWFPWREHRLLEVAKVDFVILTNKNKNIYIFLWVNPFFICSIRPQIRAELLNCSFRAVYNVVIIWVRHHAPWEPVLSRKLLRLNKVFLDARNWRNLCRNRQIHNVTYLSC